MVRVKICGITNLEDALLAAEAGADALGFVFAPSPRLVSPEQARDIIQRLPPFVAKVGVFVNAALEQVKLISETCGLDYVQLHGEESPEDCLRCGRQVIKALRVRDETSLSNLSAYRVRAFLLDGYHPHLAGGTGQSFNWTLALKAKQFGPVILSGGLTPENVAEAVRQVAPYGVDVCSGVESHPGKKDPEKVRAFVRAAKGEARP